MAEKTDRQDNLNDVNMQDRSEFSVFGGEGDIVGEQVSKEIRMNSVEEKKSVKEEATEQSSHENPLKEDISSGKEDVKLDKKKAAVNEKPLSVINSDPNLADKICEKMSEQGGPNPLGDSPNGQTMDSANITYEGDLCIYTDPASKFQYLWDGEKNEWVPWVKNTNETADSETISAASSSSVSGHNYQFDGETYIYTDAETGVTYKFDKDSNTWVVKETKDEPEKDSKHTMGEGVYGFEGDTHTYTDPSDGSVYIWDREKNAWFPKIDDDFLARYQMSYGFTTPPSADQLAEEAKKKQVEEEKEKERKKKEEEEKAKREESGQKRKQPPEPQWFELDEEHNTKVYVNNLPLDIMEQEFVDLMQKCGLVEKDASTGRMKVKLYVESDGTLKGDGLCSYLRVESVKLALELLDGYDLRGHKLKVQRAQFQMRGSYDPTLKPKKKRRKDKEKLKKMQAKLLDWRPDKMRGERSKHEKVVIIKNLFEASVFDNDVGLILEYQQDLRDECGKCGDVRRVVIYDRHPEGVAQVNFREPEEADECVKLLNGRWFGQRKITAETWDGKTKYKVVETPEQVEARLKKWEKYLAGEEEKKKEEERIRREEEERWRGEEDTDSEGASSGSDLEDSAAAAT